MDHINVPVQLIRLYGDSLLMGHDALLLRQIASVVYYTHYHMDMITHGPTLLNQSSALVGTS